MLSFFINYASNSEVIFMGLLGMIHIFSKLIIPVKESTLLEILKHKPFMNKMIK